MKPKIATVVVSRNGVEVLLELLRLLVNQTETLTEIIVVDNASSDGTLDLLSQHFPRITLIPLRSNEGVSGGYSKGLEYALRHNHDWVWMLDQDSRPSQETLGDLLAAYRLFPEREKLALIAPLPVNASTCKPYPIFLWRDGQREISTSESTGAITLVDMVISSGSLIRSQALGKAGMPRQDFFMDFVDYEHCLRLRQKGFLIGVVNRCTMLHNIGKPRTVNFLGKKRSWTTHKPWREYYKVRNRAFVVWHQHPSFRAKVFVFHQFLKQLIGSLLYESEKIDRIHFMWRGLKDGIRGRLGCTVRPAD